MSSLVKSLVAPLTAPLSSALGQDPFYSGGGGSPVITDFQSNDLFAGNIAIVNNLDLLNDGGMIWVKNRLLTGDNVIYDTARGTNNDINSNTTAQQGTIANTLTAFNNNGYTAGSAFSGSNIGWSFKNAANFFDASLDVIPAGSWTLPHNLGIQAGCVISKQQNAIGIWSVFHRSILNTQNMVLNTNAAPAVSGVTTSLTASNIDFSTFWSGGAGTTLQSYFFAHDTSPNGVSQCGSFTASGNIAVDLGWTEGIKWLMVKSASGVGNWQIFDTARGLNLQLNADSNLAEVNTGNVTASAGGFTYVPNLGQTMIYIAIRDV